MYARCCVFLGSAYLGPRYKSPHWRVFICESYVRGFCPPTTLRAAASASSLCVTPVCDLTLPVCVLYPMLSLAWMTSSASCRSSLRGWCWKHRGSMAYLRMMLMLKAISVSIERVWSFLLASSASVMAASSARFMVCLSGCDFI